MALGTPRKETAFVGRQARRAAISGQLDPQKKDMQDGMRTQRTTDPSRSHRAFLEPQERGHRSSFLPPSLSLGETHMWQMLLSPQVEKSRFHLELSTNHQSLSFYSHYHPTVGWDQVLEQLTMARNPAELWKF
jgi:hypothetical protein